MDELIKLHNNINNFVNNWDSLIHEFIMSFEPDFIDMVQDQLSKGQGGDGNNLESYSSDVYAKFKQSIGSLSSPIADLKLTGDFYEGMIMNDDFVIFSTDSKDKMLHQMFGDDITEVQDKNMAKFIKEQMLPEFEDFIKKHLGI